jgi:hypothetical protein
MQPNEKKIWFPAKKYGWGWGPPVCWQGWVVLALYVVSISLGAFFLPPDEHPAGFITSVVVLSILLTFVCWLKGEKPGWRWGGR